MSQATLTPGVGNFVADALAPELLDGTALTATGQGSWVEVDRPRIVAVHLETGTVTGTSVECEVTIESADDSSGTNSVDHGTFTSLSEADDDVDRFLVAEVWKPYMRASYVIAGTSPDVPVTVTVRDKDYHQGYRSA